MAGNVNIGHGFDVTSIDTFNALARTVTHKKALKCPCSVQGTAGGSADASCQNCRGWSFSYTNPRERSVLFHDLDLSEKFMAGGDHDSGDCMITAEAHWNWAINDIILFSGESTETTTENIVFAKKPIIGGDPNQNYWQGVTHYGADSVEVLSEWRGLNTAYEVIPRGDYTVDKDSYIIRLVSKYSQREEMICTVRYQYTPILKIFAFPRTLDSRPVASTPCSAPIQLPMFVKMRARRLFWNKSVANTHPGSDFLNNDYTDPLD